MFTRSVKDLKQTAIFIGGSDVSAAEQLLDAVTECFFGPMRVSVMLDANGANTTAAAAVLAAARHVPLNEATVLVLGGTGPVGQRAARLLAAAGASVRLGSRSVERAQSACQRVREHVESGTLQSVEAASPETVATALAGANVVISAGAAGVELLPKDVRHGASELRVAIDLNAVPPLGIGGVDATDKAVDRDGVICYGAIGVGGTKMKIHCAAVTKLFQSNSHVLDAEDIFAIGSELEAK
jgi:hypothetical protein